MYSEVDKSGFYSMITKHLKTILFDSSFYLKLDYNPYKIAFLDGIYDLRENAFCKGYSDYDYFNTNHRVRLSRTHATTNGVRPFYSI